MRGLIEVRISSIASFCMRERIAALGGSLVRDGRSGMRLEITLPLGRDNVPAAAF